MPFEVILQFIRFSVNLNALSNNIPIVHGLRDLLLSWLDHRKEVLLNISNYRLDKIEERLEILSGLLIAYLNMDEVIRIIREEDNPKEELIKRFELSDFQAESIPVSYTHLTLPTNREV